MFFKWFRKSSTRDIKDLLVEADDIADLKETLKRMRKELEHSTARVHYYVSRCSELEDALAACGKRLPAAPPPVRTK